MDLTFLKFKQERFLSLTSVENDVGQHQLLKKIQSVMLIKRKTTEGLILDWSQWKLWMWKILMTGSCERNSSSAIGLQKTTSALVTDLDMLTWVPQFERSFQEYMHWDINCPIAGLRSEECKNGLSAIPFDFWYLNFQTLLHTVAVSNIWKGKRKLKCWMDTLKVRFC